MSIARRQAAAAVGVFLLTFLMVPAPSFSLPTAEVEIFYLDANGQVVGYFFRGCDNYRVREGVTTDSKMTLSNACQNPPATTLECRWQGTHVNCAVNMFYDLCYDHYGPDLCGYPEEP